MVGNEKRMPTRPPIKNIEMNKTETAHFGVQYKTLTRINAVFCNAKITHIEKMMSTAIMYPRMESKF
jgi:hypothetical protein